MYVVKTITSYFPRKFHRTSQIYLTHFFECYWRFTLLINISYYLSLNYYKTYEEPNMKYTELEDLEKERHARLAVMVAKNLNHSITLKQATEWLIENGEFDYKREEFSMNSKCKLKLIKWIESL